MRIFVPFLCGVLAICGATTVIPAFAASTDVSSRAKQNVVFKSLYSFAGEPDGYYPAAGLLLANGSLYGTTLYGGKASNEGDGLGQGIVYALSPSGTERILRKFNGPPDGAQPQANLIALNGAFYGTTNGGGRYGCGSVFSIDPIGNERIVYSFRGGQDGFGPASALVALNGVLYGTTQEGGLNNCVFGQGCGTVFAVTTSGSERVVYRFAFGSDGASPGGLVALNGTLYGTTVLGGGGQCNDGCGTLFALTTAGKETVLNRFISSGLNEPGGLTILNGELYGTTLGQYPNFYGTVFEATTTGRVRIVYAFRGGSDASGPTPALLAAGGALYGTSYGGGPLFDGTVFEVRANGQERVLHSFVGTDGRTPYAGLTGDATNLYGTTSGGGTYEKGTVFQLTL